MDRPKERFLAVTHSGLIKMANITETHASEVHARVLPPGGTWYMRSSTGDDLTDDDFGEGTTLKLHPKNPQHPRQAAAADPSASKRSLLP